MSRVFERDPDRCAAVFALHAAGDGKSGLRLAGARTAWRIFAVLIFGASIVCVTGSGLAAPAQDQAGAPVGQEQTGQQPQTPEPVKLSADAAQALLVNSVQPRYPKKARRNGFRARFC